MTKYFRALIVLAGILMASGRLCGQSATAGKTPESKPLRVLAGHVGAVRTLSFSKDGRLLASGSSDSSVRIWDASGGQAKATLKAADNALAAGPSDPREAGIHCVAFSPDGQILAAGGADGLVRLWDTRTWGELRRFKAARRVVRCVAFSPDGKTLATASDEQLVRLWDVAGTRELGSVLPPAGGARSVAFDAAGRILALAGDGGTLQLSNAESGLQLAAMPLGIGVRSVACAPDDSGFAVGCAQGAVTLWSRSGEQISRRILAGHNLDTVALAFAPDAKTLASAGADGSLMLWNVPNGRKLTSISAHPKNAWAVAFSPDGKTLASGGDDHVIRLWDAAGLREAAASPPAPDVPPEPLRPPVPLPGETLAVSEIKRLGGKFLANGYKSTWSPDGTRIAYGTIDERGANTGAGIEVLELKHGKTTRLTDTGKDPAWSPGDGKWIAYVTGYGDEETWLVASAGGKPRNLVRGGFPTWSPDAKSVFFSFSPGPNRALGLIAVTPETAQAKKVLDLPWWYPAISPDGSRAVYRSGNDLRIVELETGKTIRQWPIGGGVGFLAGWSPDGKRVAYGGWGGNDPVRFSILHVETGRATRLANTCVTAPAWSPDGSSLAVDLRLPIGWEVWVIPTNGLAELR